MIATLDAATVRDALAVLRKYVGKGWRGVRATELVTVDVFDAGSATLRRFGNVDATASVAATGPITAGTAYVDAAALADAIGKAKGPITIAIEGGRLTVRAGSATASVPLADGADVPARDANDYVTAAVIADSELPRLRSVAQASGDGGARAVLHAVAIEVTDGENGEAVATDTYRMHVAKLRNVHRPLLIPADVIAAATVKGAGCVAIYVTEDGSRFAATYTVMKGSAKRGYAFYVRVTGAAIEGPYPNYRSLIPAPEDATTTWTVTDAAGTADVLAAFRNTKNVPAIMAALGSAVAITAQHPDGRRDAIAPMSVGIDDAIPLEVAFNPSYFRDATLHAGDGATVYLRDGLKAAVIDNGDAYALIMPMRVS